jgi:hypothetical protein
MGKGDMNARLDTTRFNRYLDELSSSLGVPREQVVRAEVGSVLKLWVIRTKVSKPEKLEYRGRREAVRLGRRATYGGTGKASELKRGQSWATMGKGGVPPMRIWIWNRKAPRSFFLLAGPGAPKPSALAISSASKSRQLQAVTQSLMPEKVRSARQASGLSRQSVVQIADALKINLDAVPGGRSVTAAVAKARQAIASDGQVYRNGVGATILDQHQYLMRLINNIPWGRSPKIKMDRTLSGILKGRIKYFENNVAHGVFAHASKKAKAYPGIRVSFPPKIEA